MTRPHKVLVIDDEPDIRELVSMTLGRMEVESREAESVGQAKELLGADQFDLCLTDMRLPDGSGIDLVRHIQERLPSLPVAVITAHGSMESAVEALKAGAFDFVSKPVKLEDLRNLVSSALKLSEESSAGDQHTRRSLLGNSAPMEQIRAMITKLSRSQAPVYISGESGTGKELVARMIHDQSPRSSEPFVPVNCGAIPTELMESEFFGHTKGSFTGAVADKEGLFQAASGGTLFLDEVAELPIHMQVKLLRAIQEKAVRAIGARTETAVDVRILSATHTNLSALVDQEKFRKDLYYRINVIEVKVPSLRERSADIAILCEHFLARLSGGSQPLPVLSDEAMQALKTYSFPGNVRELENILERALTLCDGGTITRDELLLPQVESANVEGFSPGQSSLDKYLESVERDAIQQALAQTDQNKTAAAKLLGISFRSLRYKLEKLGID
ncbi:MAG: sigma-54 dependent transcriptional regulator [Gammaproteobacteria bacterium]|nr:sigma-54 dependent transcriptional regulator [Gammaproteobacteria bacterium]